jgi:hypothetical protein
MLVDRSGEADEVYREILDDQKGKELLINPSIHSNDQDADNTRLPRSGSEVRDIAGTTRREGFRSWFRYFLLSHSSRISCYTS